MSKIQIKPFFKFCKVKVMEQTVDITNKIVKISVKPDDRYRPRCHKCGSSTKQTHSFNQRTIRDLNLFDAKTFISVIYRTVKCRYCGNMVEELPLIDPYQRVTKRLSTYILELCRFMTIKEVAKHLNLNWKTVKEIHKRYLQKKFSQKDISYPRILVVDEISIKKRHTYLTIVANWESGRVLWVGEGRKYETLKAFFDFMTKAQRDTIQAIAMDMWDPYIKAVKESCPNCLIVFDQFHVLSAFNRVIDKVRNIEFQKATKEGKEVIKGSKYLLLKNNILRPLGIGHTKSVELKSLFKEKTLSPEV